MAELCRILLRVSPQQPFLNSAEHCNLPPLRPAAPPGCLGFKSAVCQLVWGWKGHGPTHSCLYTFLSQLSTQGACKM